MPSFNFSKVNKALQTAVFPEALSLNLETRTSTGTYTIPAHAWLPIPKNALGVNSALGLYEDNVRIPAQIEVVQYWDVINTIPKWLHIHFLATYENGVPRSYTVKEEILPDSPPSTNLSYIDSGGLITVENGFVKIEVSKTAFCGVQKMWHDPTGAGSYGSPILDSVEGGPIHTGVGGRKWKPKHQPTNTVVVEEEGPVKITIFAEGVTQNFPYNPNRHVQFRNRIVMYAGLPWVLFQHDFAPDRRTSSQRYDDTTKPITPSRNTPAACFTRKIYGLEYSFPFSNLTDYKLGVDGSTISDTIPAFVDNTPATDLLTNLVAYWKMDEASGTRYDSVGSSHLKINGTVGTVAGVIGNATNFDGKNVQSNLELDYQDDIVVDVGGTTSFAFSLWVKLDTITAGQNHKILSRLGVNYAHSIASDSDAFFNVGNLTYDRNGITSGNHQIQRCFQLEYNVSSNRFRAIFYSTTMTAPANHPDYIIANIATCNSLGAASTGTWYHIVVNYDGNTKVGSIYGNGNTGSPGTVTITGDFAHAFTPFVFGTLSNPSPYTTAQSTFNLDGSICSCGFWRDRTLTNAEISSLYNAGAGNEYPFGLTPTEPAINNTVVFMHQHDHNKVRLLGDAAANDPTGLERSDGWVEVENSTGSKIGMLTKWMWQKYPKEVEISENGLTYHYWPKNGFDCDPEDEFNPQEIHKFQCFHKRKVLNVLAPFEYGPYLEIGPGYICTFNTSGSVVTTAENHGWVNGQLVQFARGNTSATLPPEIIGRSYFFTGSGSITGAADGSNNGTYYYVRKLTDTTFTIHTSSAGAIANTGQVTFTTNGSGLLFVGSRYTDTYNTIDLEISTQESDPTIAVRGFQAGISNYNEFALILSDSGDTPNYDEYYDFYVNKPIASPSAEWRSYSNALGHLAPKSAYFTEIENSIETAITRWWNPDLLNNYGQYNFGDGPGSNFHFDTHRQDIYRCWSASHYYAIRALWTTYYHNPTENILNAARIMTDHYASVDAMKFIDGTKHVVRYSHGKAVNQWGAKGAEGGWWHWGDSEGVLFGWLIDANRWWKNVYDLNYDAAYNWHFPLVNSEVSSARGGAAENGFREYTGSLAKAVMMYNHTHDPRFLPAIDTVGKAAITIPDLHSNIDYTTNYHPTWMNNYVEMTRDPEYLDANGVRRYLDGETRSIVNVLGYDYPTGALGWTLAQNSFLTGDIRMLAYDATGDENYLIDLLCLYEDMSRKLIRLPSTVYDGMGFGTGPQGEWNAWSIWPNLLRGLLDAGITQIPNRDNIQDYYCGYMVGVASISSTSPDINSATGVGLTVLVYNATSNPWTFSLKQKSYGGSTRAIAFMVLNEGTSPGSEILRQGFNSNLWHDPDIDVINGNTDISSLLAVTVNSTTDVLTFTSAITYWKDTQFIQFFPGSTTVLPASTPQIEYFKHYYVRFLTASTGSNATFKVYETVEDAYNNTNPINFTSTGTNVLIHAKGEMILNLESQPTTKTVMPIYPGVAGLHRIVLSMDAPRGIVLYKCTDLPEAQLIRNGHAIYTNATRGYLVPLQTYPINILIESEVRDINASITSSSFVNVLVKDADGDIVFNESVGKTKAGVVDSSVTLTINNNDGRPTPWFIDIFCSGYGRFKFTATPVGGETDIDLMLYGKNLSEVNLIKTVLES